MTALTTGAMAPTFTLPTVDGKTFSLSNALAEGPVLLAFFKVSCPTCQYAFPFLERIHRAYGGKFRIIGISQNKGKDTLAFMKEYGVTFPVALDDTSNYPVSNMYGLTNVPTLFWVGKDGVIELSSVGWAKQDVNEMNRKASEALQQKYAPLFHNDESIAAFRAG
jgi:peroxiredoxin